MKIGLLVGWLDDLVAYGMDDIRVESTSSLDGDALLPSVNSISARCACV